MRIVKTPNGSIDRFTRAIVLTIPFDLALSAPASTEASGLEFTGSADTGAFTGSVDSGTFTGGR